MNVFPVIARELRVESRQGMNYWLRVFSGAAAIVVFFFTWIGNFYWATPGKELFTNLQTTIFVIIWLVVPMMAADCISREKRDGTLGLLFLTPLKAGEIIIGKSFVHALRALTLFLSIFPMLTIPLLMGGVAWMDIYTAFIFDVCFLLLALSAGIFASSWGKMWGRTLLLSVVFAAVLAICLSILLSILFYSTSDVVDGLAALFELEGWILGVGVMVPGVFGESWSSLVVQLPGLSRGGGALWPRYVGEASIAALLIFGYVLLLARRRLTIGWQEEPPSIRKVWWWKTFCTPQFWKSIFRNRMRRALDRNPVGWLHQFSWSARLVKWGWCFGVIVLETGLMVVNDLHDFYEAQIYVFMTVVGGFSLTAAGSFRRERETGALELLLVTPLTVRNLIWGRVRGIYGQFGWTLAFLIFCLGMVWIPDGGVEFYQIACGMIAIHFATIPIIGLYCSLTVKNFLLAWILTAVYGVLAPLLLGVLSFFGGLFLGIFVLGQGWLLAFWCLAYVMGHFLVARLIYKRLVRNLSQRRFAFRSGT